MDEEKVKRKFRIEKLKHDLFLVKVGAEARRNTIVKVQGDKRTGSVSLPQNVCLPSYTVGKRVRVLIEIIKDERKKTLETDGKKYLISFTRNKSIEVDATSEAQAKKEAAKVCQLKILKIERVE